MRIALPFQLLLTLTTLMSLTGFATATPALADNLHLIEENEVTGYAMYRSGKPSEDELKEFCRLGIQEIMVLSGNADKAEYRYPTACPTLKVVYNKSQNAKTPLSSTFITQFDAWVESAKQRGIKVAFRCTCGCHRTGRLAAYYQMKFQGVRAAEAVRIMKKKGKYMWLYPHLWEQVYALEDYIAGRGCSVKQRSCVREI